MMPGLPTMTPNEDINDFKKLFNDSNLKPDMLKIYPSLVLKNTPLYNDYLEKNTSHILTKKCYMYLLKQKNGSKMG